jgi:hypothetical protein
MHRILRFIAFLFAIQFEKAGGRLGLMWQLAITGLV